MASEDYRNKLEQQAIERLEGQIKSMRQNRASYIHYLTLDISDIERLLYYVKTLEHELAYRDTMASVPPWMKE